MLQYVTLSIDGAKARAPKGTSVLDAAVHDGICIPHLCHTPDLSDMGACRLCIVEHVRNGASKITASCTLLVQEGMVIRANSDRVRKLRRNVAELLLTEAPNSRAIQDMAVRCGVKQVRYPFRNEECVLCGRCVRVCEEVVQASALGLVGRGDERRVDYPFGVRPKSCKRCLMCTYVCPMTLPPCEGPLKPGEAYLCERCQAQLSIADAMPGTCVYCELGKGFQCARHAK